MAEGTPAAAAISSLPDPTQGDPFISDAHGLPQDDSTILELELKAQQQDLHHLLSTVVPGSLHAICAALKEVMFLLSATKQSFPIGEQPTSHSPLKGLLGRRNTHARSQSAMYTRAGSVSGTPGNNVTVAGPGTNDSLITLSGAVSGSVHGHGNGIGGGQSHDVQGSPGRMSGAGMGSGGISNTVVHHDRMGSHLAAGVMSSRPSLRGHVTMEGCRVSQAELAITLPRASKTRKEMNVQVLASRPYVLEQLQDAYNFVCMAFRRIQAVQDSQRALGLRDVIELLDMITAAVSQARTLVVVAPTRLVFPQSDCPPNITMPVLPPHMVLEMVIHSTSLVVRAYGLIPCGHQHETKAARGRNSQGTPTGEQVVPAPSTRLSIDESRSGAVAGRVGGSNYDDHHSAAGLGGQGGKAGGSPQVKAGKQGLHPSSASVAGVPGSSPKGSASNRDHAHGRLQGHQSHNSLGNSGGGRNRLPDASVLADGREFYFRDQWLRVGDRVESSYPIPSLSTAIEHMDTALEVSTNLSRKASVYYCLM